MPSSDISITPVYELISNSEIEVGDTQKDRDYVLVTISFCILLACFILTTKVLNKN